MYAVLITLGIANIIFNEDFSPTNLFDITNILFITAVVFLYWWDWSEYVESEIKTTKLETSIDFLLLISLFMLYYFYSEPIGIAFVFLILGIIDLAWVINHLFEISSKEKIISIDKRGWILEKIVCISIYGLTIALLYLFVNLLESQFIIKWIQIILIIGAFILVRCIGFKSIKQEPRYFSKAKLKDVDQIIEINKSYLTLKTKSGFFIRDLEKKEVIDSIEKGENSFYVVEGKKGRVLGYAEILEEIDNVIIDNLDWVDEKDKKILLKNDYLLISKIATRRGIRRKGIGKFLYENLFENYKDKDFFAFIVTKPVENKTSIKFHKKMGFRKVAYFSKNEFMDIKNYESILLVKECKKN